MFLCGESTTAATRTPATPTSDDDLWLSPKHQQQGENVSMFRFDCTGRDNLPLNPAMIFLVSQVHLLSDLLGQADGVLAFREVLESSPALRALMAEARSRGDPMVVDESQYQLVEEKLGEKQPK